ncbi:MAG: hypothetical protein ACRDE7_08040 [Sphingobacterium sp.]
MENYVLIFKTSIRTVFERSVLIAKLLRMSKEIIEATIDLDDEDYILRIESHNDNKNLIMQTLQKEGYEVDFLEAFSPNHSGSPVLLN